MVHDRLLAPLVWHDFGRSCYLVVSAVQVDRKLAGLCWADSSGHMVVASQVLSSMEVGV